MEYFSIYLKRASLALFFILAACKLPCPHWLLVSIDASVSCFNSKKLTLTPENKFCELEVEIAYCANNLRMYLNVFSLELMPESPMQSSLAIKISSDGKEQMFYGYLFLGGQRVLIPEEARDWIIECLHLNQAIYISLGRYSSKIMPYDFAAKYQALIHD